ncbi:uncharacterized protein LOC142563060 [Dermacentor variabilis]|uniref:uncharacterized protein LOC142563060 n=1 Tax=Dermacentor variabilis TaxID=34621 RepID=UPI003F5B3F98
MYPCVQTANPEVEYDCDVYLYIRPLSYSEYCDSVPTALSPSPTLSSSSEGTEDTQLMDLDFLKHWQAVFVFKSNASHTDSSRNGVVMLEAGKASGYLEGEGFVTSLEVLEMENPRKVFLRSTRFSLKTLMNALSAMNASRSAYCFVWNNCQEWITGLMRRLNVAVRRTRVSKVANAVIAVASLCLLAYVVYLSYCAGSSYRWQHSDGEQWVPRNAG